MIEFELKCSPDVLAINLLLRGKLGEHLQAHCWKTYTKDCELAQYDWQAFLKNVSETNELLNEIKSSKEFAENLEACEKNLERIELNLKRNKNRIDTFLKNVCGVDFSIPKQTVYIVALDGRNSGNNVILWGHPKGLRDPYYDLVYIYHEALHSMFNKIKDQFKLRDTWEFDHVLIQYLTDIELARLLTGNRYDTHAYLEELEYKCYPYVQLFLNKTPAQLKKENSTSKIKVGFNKDKHAHLQETFADFNIVEFYKWILTNRNDILSTKIEKHIVID